MLLSGLTKNLGIFSFIALAPNATILPSTSILGNIILSQNLSCILLSFDFANSFVSSIQLLVSLYIEPDMFLNYISF